MADRINGTFYKYRMLDEYGRKTLSMREFYYSPPSKLNDPVDCYPYVSLDLDAKRTRQYVDSLVRKTYPHAHGKGLQRFVSLATAEWRNEFKRSRMLYKEIDDNTGVLSMSRAFNSAWQWSHYAGGHRGFCIAVRCGEGLTIDPVYAVTYSSERPVIDMKRLLDDPKYQREELFLVLLRKSQAWKNEDEVRGIASPHGARIAESDEIAGVYLGARMRGTHRQDVRALMQQGGLAHVPVYQMKFDARTYALNHERIGWREVL